MSSDGADTLVQVQGQQKLMAQGGRDGDHAKGATCCATVGKPTPGGGTATGGETVFNPLIPCTPGDAGKGGWVLVAY